MKVAYYSPLPPERTGIADYSALLLPELQRRLDVESSAAESGARLAGPTRPLPHRATTRTRMAGSSPLFDGAAASSCFTTSSSTT